MDLPPSYLDRIRACFPDLALDGARMNRDGLVNDVLIAGELVFRFPKDEPARQAQARETAVLDLVRSYVELPIPHFEHRAEDFVMYRRLPGEPLHQHDILAQDEAGRDRLAQQLGTFLRQLHTIPRAEIEQHTPLRPRPLRRREDYAQRLDSIEREVFPHLMAFAKEWVARLFAPVLDGRLSLEYEPALIHDDLAAYHVLCDRAVGTITGVIDFGTAGLDDPAADFGLIINAFGERFLRRMARFYPEIEPALDRARFFAGVLELEWLLGGLRSNDPSWYMCHIGRARDIGDG